MIQEIRRMILRFDEGDMEIAPRIIIEMSRNGLLKKGAPRFSNYGERDEWVMTADRIIEKFEKEIQCSPENIVNFRKLCRFYYRPSETRQNRNVLSMSDIVRDNVILEGSQILVVKTDISYTINFHNELSDYINELYDVGFCVYPRQRNYFASAESMTCIHHLYYSAVSEGDHDAINDETDGEFESYRCDLELSDANDVSYYPYSRKNFESEFSIENFSPDNPEASEDEIAEEFRDWIAGSPPL